MANMKIEFDFRKLRARIVEKFGTLTDFSIVADIEIGTLSNRLRNKTKWPPDEIVRVCAPDLLDIPGEQMHIYFFTPKF